MTDAEIVAENARLGLRPKKEKTTMKKAKMTTKF
jgi:hypothetical protein